MPPHEGHLYLIQRGRRCVDQLTVVLLSLPDEPIDPKLRLAWLDELVGDQVRLEHVQPYPTDYSDPGVWDQWVATIRSVLPTGPDLVFSSEEYGRQLADLLGAEHRMIDRDRQAVPISASQIRNDPMGAWPFIPEPVRPWYVRRVAVLGPPGPDRAELVEHLGRTFQTVTVPDPGPGRQTDRAGSVAWHELERLARRAEQIEALLARRANRLLVREGGLVQMQAWAQLQFGRWPESLDRGGPAMGAELALLDRRGIGDLPAGAHARRLVEVLAERLADQAIVTIPIDSQADLAPALSRIRSLIRPHGGNR
jgi:NadR type nicotinamide-nucleotide adenylyltransferase